MGGDWYLVEGSPRQGPGALGVLPLWHWERGKVSSVGLESCRHSILIPSEAGSTEAAHSFAGLLLLISGPTLQNSTVVHVAFPFFFPFKKSFVLTPTLCITRGALCKSVRLAARWAALCSRNFFLHGFFHSFARNRSELHPSAEVISRTRY